MNKQWKRKCPKCGEELIYSRLGNLNLAKKRNTNCKSCVWGSEKVRKNISESVSGKNNSMYGKCAYNIWLEKYGKKEADRRQKEQKKKMSESKLGKNHPMYGKKQSEIVKKKIRLTTLKNIENKCGQVSPNYNPETIPIIDEYSKKHGFNFRHAENGGEVCIDGYFPDGVDETRKTIIEIDEKHHFNIDGKLKQKDIQRQNYLESLGYKIIRVRI